jgi:hypothetical protein
MAVVHRTWGLSLNRPAGPVLEPTPIRNRRPPVPQAETSSGSINRIYLIPAFTKLLRAAQRDSRFRRLSDASTPSLVCHSHSPTSICASRPALQPCASLKYRPASLQAHDLAALHRPVVHPV